MTIEEKYEVTTMFHPILATELTVVPLQTIKDCIGVSTPNSIYLQGLEESVQYLQVGKAVFLPLATAISLVQRSKMETQRKRDTVLEFMQLLYAPVNSHVGALLSALENAQGEQYTKLHQDIANAVNAYGSRVVALYNSAFHKLNHTTADPENTQQPTEEIA